MATAVLDLDIDALPRSLEGVEGCDSALVLLRVQGRPAGQAVIPLGAAEIGGADLKLLLLERADSSFWEAWLRGRLGMAPSVRAGTQAQATVAICTRDRTEDLARCLASLQAMPDDGQEILVIDNAPSSEETRELVRRFPAIRYVREDRPGLDVARNRALREARGEIVAFTDDDASMDRLWLRTLLRNFEDPLVMCATGLTMALELQTGAQVSFQRCGGFVRGFHRMVFDAAVHDPMLGWQAGAGVSMALRRAVVERVGEFDEALDAGTPTHAGGDSDMFRRILKAGFRIVYDPEALNWHRHRRSDAELKRQLVGYEIAGFAVFSRTLLFEGDLGGAAQAARWLGRELRGLVRAIMRRPGAPALDLLLSRIGGALMGPGLYLHSRRRAR